jgi:hypothetical protein
MYMSYTYMTIDRFVPFFAPLVQAIPDHLIYFKYISNYFNSKIYILAGKVLVII